MPGGGAAAAAGLVAPAVAVPLPMHIPKAWPMPPMDPPSGKATPPGPPTPNPNPATAPQAAPVRKAVMRNDGARFQGMAPGTDGPPMLTPAANLTGQEERPEAPVEIFPTEGS